MEMLNRLNELQVDHIDNIFSLIVIGLLILICFLIPSTLRHK